MGKLVIQQLQATGDQQEKKLTVKGKLKTQELSQMKSWSLETTLGKSVLASQVMSGVITLKVLVGLWVDT